MGFHSDVLNITPEVTPWDDSSSANQEILHILRNQKLHHRVHMTPPLDFVLT
jgi:hypothetical protein